MKVKVKVKVKGRGRGSEGPAFAPQSRDSGEARPAAEPQARWTMGGGKMFRLEVEF